jgi:hypothetical protein
MSTRKKPPPKGDVTSNENGQKTVTNVKRAQGRKNTKKKQKTADDNVTEPDDIDPNEPRYCICDDVSYGDMIQCDNDVSISFPSTPPFLASSRLHYSSSWQMQMLILPQCEKEWFHYECVGMTAQDLPSRRTKWYCPDCRVAKGVDAYGNPLIPPPLPGRRGNR